MSKVYVTLSRMSNVKPLDLPEGVPYSGVMAKKKLPPEVLSYFVKMGKRGGLKGGPARAARMSAEERSASARAAVQARWSKSKGTSAT